MNDLVFGATIVRGETASADRRQEILSNAELALRRAIHHITVARSAEKGFIPHLARAWADLKELL